MRIQCDACNSAAASLFCSSDEAALCSSCDRRIHHVNKLTQKHHRHTFLKESTNPLCDVCQDRRAFFFCKQDRAVLCRDCDMRIHNANRYTLKHTRLLLAGVRISPPSPVTVSEDGDDSAYSVVPENPISGLTDSETTAPVSQGTFTTEPALKDSVPTTAKISDYLMEMLPGWRVDDFLDSPIYDDNTASNVFKNDEGGSYLPERRKVEASPSPNFGIWVPHPPPQPSAEVPQQWDFLQTGVEQFGEDMKNLSSSALNNVWWAEDAFTVPQISRMGSKRSRQF